MTQTETQDKAAAASSGSAKMIYLPEALKARRDALAANHRASERAVALPANTPEKPRSALPEAHTTTASDPETHLDLARMAYAIAKADFSQCGRRLVTQVARLRSLTDLCAQHGAERGANEVAQPEHDLSCSAAGAGEDALSRIRGADRLIYDLPATAKHGTSGTRNNPDRLAAEISKRGAALIRLTEKLNSSLDAVQVQIGARAASLFEAHPDAMKGAMLRQIIVDARIDIASELLQSGLDEALVADLTHLDADVTLALAAELS